jgi:cytochrome o ubiquinol oxidase subunit 1
VAGFNAIHMPRNTGAGFILAALSGIFGFAMIWRIWWLAVLGLVTVLAVAIAHTFNYQRDFHIPASEVARTEGERTRLLGAQA